MNGHEVGGVEKTSQTGGTAHAKVQRREDALKIVRLWN